MDLGISEYGDTAVLSHLTEQEMNNETIDKPGFIPAECLRHIILDLGLLTSSYSFFFSFLFLIFYNISIVRGA